MTTTIDRAGRVVIPASVRRRVGFHPGCSLEIKHENGVVLISRNVPRPQLEDRAGRLVARPKAEGTEEPDWATLVEEERERWPR